MTIHDNYRKSILQGDKDIYKSVHLEDMKCVARKIRKSIQFNEIKKVIDIGCGPGVLINQLKNNNNPIKYYGVDISKDQINEALKVCAGVDFFNTDGLSYLKKIKDNSIDLITMIDVAEHLDLNDLISTFSECERVLSKNGVIFIRVPNATAINNPILYGDLTHKRAFTLQSLNQLANFSNLSIDLFDGVYFENKRIIGFVRELIMYIFYYPFLKLFYRLVYGNKIGGHYSTNVYCVFKKISKTR